MSKLFTYAKRQFGHPHGPLGYIAGLIMRYKNDHRLELVVERLELQGSERILELGCGPGAAIRKIVPRLTSGSITAVDRSELMLRMAARYNDKAVRQDRVHLVPGIYPDVDLPVQHFDLIFGVNVHLFWEEPSEVLQRIRAQLRPEGVVHLFFHPHWEENNARVREIGAGMQEAFREAGFAAPELRFESLHPVDMIHVQALASS